MRRGLLQESGAMRGLLTAVVRDMMMENDILPVTKKAHAPDLGSGVARRVGSSPIRRTTREGITPPETR